MNKKIKFLENEESTSGYNSSKQSKNHYKEDEENDDDLLPEPLFKKKNIKKKVGNNQIDSDDDDEQKVIIPEKYSKFKFKNNEIQKPKRFQGISKISVSEEKTHESEDSRELEIEDIFEELLNEFDKLEQYGFFEDKKNFDQALKFGAKIWKDDSPELKKEPSKSNVKSSLLLKSIKLKIDNLNNKLAKRYKFVREDLINLEYIGNGAFGSVRRLFNPKTRIFYAEKTIDASKIDDFEYRALKEIRNLINLMSWNESNLLIVYSIQYKIGESSKILMEYGSGDLSSIAESMQDFESKHIEGFFSKIIKEIFNQMNLLKKYGIYHRDIKPQNIILSSDNTFKMIDYSLASFAKNDYVENIKPCGTPGFWAPEVEIAYKNKEKLNYNLWEADLFSFGKTLESINHKFNLSSVLKIQEFLMEKRLYIANEFELENFIRMDEVNLIMMKRKIKSMYEKNSIADIDDYIQVLRHHSLYQEYMEWLVMKNSNESLDMDNLTENLLDIIKLQFKSGLNIEAFSNIEKLKKLQLNDNQKIRMQIYLSLGHFHSNDFERSLAEIQVADKIIKENEPKSQSFSTDIQIMHAANYFEQIKFKEALSVIEEAYLILKSRFNPFEELSILPVFSLYGIILYRNKKEQDSLRFLEKAEELYSKKYGIFHPEIAYSFLYLGIILFERTNFSEALKTLSNSLEIFKKLYGFKHPKILFLYKKIAEIYLKQNLNEKAVSEYKKGLEMLEFPKNKIEEDEKKDIIIAIEKILETKLEN